MAELTPPNRNISLDDLLEANKARFDRIFEVQMRESAWLDPDPLPPANGDPASGPDRSDGTSSDNAAPPPPIREPAQEGAAVLMPEVARGTASRSRHPGHSAPARRPAGDASAAPRPATRTEARGAARAASLRSIRSPSI